MKPLFKNRYLDTIAKSTLLLACIHISTLILYVLLTGRYEILSAFSILGFALFFPQLGKGSISFIVATAVLFLIYIVIFVTLTGKNSQKTEKKRA